MAGEMDHLYIRSNTFDRTLKPANKSNVLECRVCEDVFALQGDKVPRLLYCGHTVCHACLLRLPLREESILCPFDRQPTPVGNSGVWGLKKNFALLELLERLQLTVPVEKPMTAAERQRQPAAGCDEDGSHPASVFCTVCLTQLCEPCSELIHATRTLSKHRRVPLSEKPRERPRCATHQSHVAEFTCLEEQCQSLPPGALLMCFICKDYGRHKSHKHALVEMEAESIRASVVETVQHMRKFMEDMSDTVHKLELAVQRLEGGDDAEGTADGARLRVAQHFAAQREALARQETAARTTVDTHVRDRVCSLRQLQEDLATSVSQVASVCVQCEQSALLDDARLLAAGREIREALDFVDKQQQQFAQLGAEELLPDAAIPITFTKDHRVHIGPHVVMRVLTLGLDAAGKTSILFKLKNDEFIAAVPTIGFNVETVEHNDLVFTVWDVGGQPKLRPLWRHYYFNTQAVVFVIDSADRDRLDEALCELAKLLSEKELKDASLLILANKQDVDGCASIEELAQTMSLSKLCAGRSWHVQACDAQSGTGLRDGLDWLSRQIVIS